MISFKKTQSLRQILVKTDNSNQTHAPTLILKGNYRCGSCSVCHMANETKIINFPELGFSHSLDGFFNCRTQMCIYLLSYKCVLHYVGSTRRQLKVRIQEHISRLRHNVPDAPLVQHFPDVGHQPADFCFTVLETIKP